MSIGAIKNTLIRRAAIASVIVPGTLLVFVWFGILGVSEMLDEARQCWQERP